MPAKAPAAVIEAILRDSGPAFANATLLRGVTVRVYEGRDGWYGSILRSREVYPDPPFTVGNRPMVDQGSGRWWYDFSAGSVNFDLPPEHPERHRTSAQARAVLQTKMADALVMIAAHNMRSLAGDLLDSIVPDGQTRGEWSA